MAKTLGVSEFKIKCRMKFKSLTGVITCVKCMEPLLGRKTSIGVQYICNWRT